jgi:hypothetical protein
VVLTALLGQQVVRILQLLVLLEPTPVVQQRVIPVPVENTTTTAGNPLAKHVPVENTTTKTDNLLNPLA